MSEADDTSTFTANDFEYLMRMAQHYASDCEHRGQTAGAAAWLRLIDHLRTVRDDPRPRLTPRNTQACFVPKPCDEREAEIYRNLLRIHCDRKDEPNHGCRGAITVRRNSITLQCPLCGDARKTML